MTLLYYRPSLREQLQEPEAIQPNPNIKCACGRFNCNMCAAASYLERVTLGGNHVSGCSMRRVSGTHGHCTDTNPLNNGTTIEVAASALAKYGRHLQVLKGRSIDKVFRTLGMGSPVILHGDYDGVPLELRGDREFHGFHSVLLNERDALRKRTLVFDSLDDGRADQPTGRKAPHGPIYWPDNVVEDYANRFPDGVVFGYENVKSGLNVDVPRAHVRSTPHRTTGNILATLDRGEYRDRGAVEHGERIGGDDRWYRVWLPHHETVGFIHASVVRLYDGTF